MKRCTFFLSFIHKLITDFLLFSFFTFFFDPFTKSYNLQLLFYSYLLKSTASRRSLSDLANFLCPGETDSSFSCRFYSASIDAAGAESTTKRDTESCASPAALTFPELFHRFDRFRLCEDLFHFGCLRCGESKQTAAILDRWMWRQESCS